MNISAISNTYSLSNENCNKPCPKVNFQSRIAQRSLIKNATAVSTKKGLVSGIRDFLAMKHLYKVLGYLVTTEGKVSKHKEKWLDELILKNDDIASKNYGFELDVLHSRIVKNTSKNQNGTMNEDAADWGKYLNNTLSLILAKTFMPKSVKINDKLGTSVEDIISKQAENSKKIVTNLRTMRHSKTSQSEYNKCLSEIYDILDKDPNPLSFKDVYSLK